LDKETSITCSFLGPLVYRLYPIKKAAIASAAFFEIGKLFGLESRENRSHSARRYETPASNPLGNRGRMGAD